MEQEKKHRYIFLDIDGVLASLGFLIKREGFVEPEKVSMLNSLKGAEIVISSSWGYDNGRTEKCLRDAGLELPIVGYTEHVSLKNEWLCRGNEIEKWLRERHGGMGTKWGKRYQSEDYSYVIIDDDTDFLLGQKDNLIITNRDTGITEKDIEKCKEILS